MSYDVYKTWGGKIQWERTASFYCEMLLGKKKKIFSLFFLIGI